MSLPSIDTSSEAYQVPTMITVHCADSKNGAVYPVERMREDHLKRGFKDIGYHKIIQPNGQIDDGRPLNKEGAHVAGHNKGNIGICLVGTDQFTRLQWDALRRTLDGLIMVYQIVNTELYCHNQFDTAIKEGKTCPTFSVNILLMWYFMHNEKAIKGKIFTGLI